MTPSRSPDPLHAFDDTVGDDVVIALERLVAIAAELATIDRTDSVAAMTRSMALDDDRDAQYEKIAITLLDARLGLLTRMQ